MKANLEINVGCEFVKFSQRRKRAFGGTQLLEGALYT